MIHSTIVDKNLGTNLHLWSLQLKQIVAREYDSTCSVPPHSQNVKHVC